MKAGKRNRNSHRNKNLLQEAGMEPIMKEYCELVGFLGKVLGQDYEIILHDLSNMDHSVIAVANGHVSGRRIGSPHE